MNKNARIGDSNGGEEFSGRDGRFLANRRNWDGSGLVYVTLD
jgi:hypothetical protein